MYCTTEDEKCSIHRECRYLDQILYARRFFFTKGNKVLIVDIVYRSVFPDGSLKSVDYFSPLVSRSRGDVHFNKVCPKKETRSKLIHKAQSNIASRMFSSCKSSNACDIHMKAIMIKVFCLMNLF